MKLDAPRNPNYAATVISVKTLVELANCDNVVGLPLWGYQAIVGKDTQVGDLGLLFPAECQLTDEYAAMNNLYRHADLNNEPDKKGYLEDNRRVKAIKFRGHTSSALYMPLSSLSYALPLKVKDTKTGDRSGVIEAVANWTELKEGDTFDTINGHEICRKYVNPRNRMQTPNNQSKRSAARVDPKFLPEHIDTENFFKVVDGLDPNINVVVTQKLHGTSIRIGNTIVRRPLNWVERIAKWWGVEVQETEYDNVYGSRKVIKDANNPNQNHYYSEDLYTRYGKELDAIVPKGYIVYGELVGWTSGGAPIQAHYTYNAHPGKAELYVYRVAHVNPDGVQSDLSWDGVRAFCGQNGLKHVRELYRTKVGNLVYKNFGGFSPLDEILDTKFTDIEEGMGFRDKVVPLSDDSPCDEGVAIRAEGIVPRIWKAKSPLFLNHETKMLDQEVVDIEAEEQVAEPVG